MAQLSQEDLASIEEALKRWRRKDSFESALSRSVRKGGGNYEDYIRIISEMRERARRDGVEVHEVGRVLVSEGGE